MKLDSAVAEALARELSRATGEPFAVEGAHPVRGGCINEAWVVEGAGRRCFVKLNSAAALDMFEAEADGLRELAAADAIRVPRPLVAGIAAKYAFLVTEHLVFEGRCDPRRLGEDLASLHRHAGTAHGWHRDNTIGSTPQHNATCSRWRDFWRERRLLPQLERAERNGHSALRPLRERLLGRSDALLAKREPPASLLHGDLWGGNVAGLPDGTPVLFDPAVYFGDRETDLAMAALFGGFPGEFYAAYQAAWALDPGHEERRPLYQLYHLLNHLNLFGAGYLGEVHRCLATLGV
jgi:fructosamine-3-kinase